MNPTSRGGPNPPIRASGWRRAQLCVSADRRAALCAIRTLHPLGALRWGDQRMAVRSYDFHPPLSADWGGVLPLDGYERNRTVNASNAVKMSIELGHNVLFIKR
jgi:hypothetical protein